MPSILPHQFDERDNGLGNCGNCKPDHHRGQRSEVVLGEEVAPGFGKVGCEVAISGDEEKTGCEDQIDGHPPFEKGESACRDFGVGVEGLYRNKCRYADKPRDSLSVLGVLVAVCE